MEGFCYEEYFNDCFNYDDFCQVVDSLVPEVEYIVDVPLVSIKVEEYKPPLKKAKKTYAAQIQELKDEILQLREEIEVRDSQLLALITFKT